MHYGEINYMQDGLITSHSLNSKNEEIFINTFKISRNEFKELHSLYNEWRLYLAAKLTEASYLRAKQEKQKFNFVEC